MAEERDEKIESIKKVTKALGKDSGYSDELIERVAPNKDYFQNLMGPEKDPSIAMNTNKNASNPTDAASPTENSGNTLATRQEKDLSSIANNNQKASDPKTAVAPNDQVNANSLMDEVRKLHTKVRQASHLTPEDLKTQARELIAQIESTKTQLSSATSDIKPSYQVLMRNRLTHVDESLKIALSKAGVEYQPPVTAMTENASAKPLDRFLSYLTHGQYQLDHLSDIVSKLNSTHKQLTPANMLAIQIKVSQIQQEIELFTSLLNKALESTKTIMNVQV